MFFEVKGCEVFRSTDITIVPWPANLFVEPTIIRKTPFTLTFPSKVFHKPIITNLTANFTLWRHQIVCCKYEIFLRYYSASSNLPFSSPWAPNNRKSEKTLLLMKNFCKITDIWAKRSENWNLEACIKSLPMLSSFLNLSSFSPCPDRNSAQVILDI